MVEALGNIRAFYPADSGASEGLDSARQRQEDVRAHIPCFRLLGRPCTKCE